MHSHWTASVCRFDLLLGSFARAVTTVRHIISKAHEIVVPSVVVKARLSKISCECVIVMYGGRGLIKSALRNRVNRQCQCERLTTGKTCNPKQS